MHTPGPWKWRDVYNDDSRKLAVILETEHRPMPCNDPVIFALREDWIGKLTPEREAAKRLIAAAPDLLAALKAFVECAPSIPEPLASLARNAVAKAEGR